MWSRLAQGGVIRSIKDRWNTSALGDGIKTKLRFVHEPSTATYSGTNEVGLERLSASI